MVCCLSFTDFSAHSNDSDFVGVLPLLPKIAVSLGLHWIYFLNASGRKQPDKMPLTHPHIQRGRFHPCILSTQTMNFLPIRPEFLHKMDRGLHHFP